MSDNYQLYLDAASVAAADANKRGLLDVPSTDENDTLYVRGENDKKWRELMEIKDTGMAPWEDRPEIMKVTVQYRVTEDAYEKNARKVLTKTYWVNTKAVKDPAHKDFKRTMIALGNLNALVRAAGLTLEKDDDGRVAYHEYFSGTKPLVGRRFWAVVRDYQYKNRDGEIVPDQEITSFLPEDK